MPELTQGKILEYLKPITDRLEEIAKLAEVPNVTLIYSALDKRIELANSNGTFIDYNLFMHTYNKYACFSIVNPTVQTIASFVLAGFPGSCAIVVSTNSKVYYPYNDKGIGDLCNKIRQDLARAGGYTALFCTDVVTAVKNKHILEKNDFKTLYSLTNKRTDNKINMYYKEL